MAGVPLTSAPAAGAFSRPVPPSPQLRADYSTTDAPWPFPYSAAIKAEAEDEPEDLTPPYSPSSDYDSLPHSSPSPCSSSPRPYLSSTPPFPSFPHLPHLHVVDVRISDNSRSQANPSQKKKGGCKAVQVVVRLGADEWVVGGKCDVRKSFSNSSFSKHYERGQWGVVGVDREGGVVLVVEEAKKGRDGKWFVGMERGCTPPHSADDGNPRHPLLAFSADSVYRLTVMTRGEGVGVVGGEEVGVEVKCLFEQGSATVIRKRPAGGVGEQGVVGVGVELGRVKRQREVVGQEGDEEEEGRGHRVRQRQSIVIERPLSVSSSLSSLSTSPCPTLAPSSPDSSSSSSTSTPPASPYLSSYLSMHQVTRSDDLLFADDFQPLQTSQGASLLMLGSPFRSPMGLRGLEGRWAEGMVGEISPLFAVMEGVLVEVPEFELK